VRCHVEARSALAQVRDRTLYAFQPSSCNLGVYASSYRNPAGRLLPSLNTPPANDLDCKVLVPIGLFDGHHYNLHVNTCYGDHIILIWVYERTTVGSRRFRLGRSSRPGRIAVQSDAPGQERQRVWQSIGTDAIVNMIAERCDRLLIHFLRRCVWRDVSQRCKGKGFAVKQIASSCMVLLTQTPFFHLTALNQDLSSVLIDKSCFVDVMVDFLSSRKRHRSADRSFAILCNHTR
jgi:hypothetical protein